jgi:hypothetical protein
MLARNNMLYMEVEVEFIISMKVTIFAAILRAFSNQLLCRGIDHAAGWRGKRARALAWSIAIKFATEM